jgi:6-phosphogluconolactonase
MLSRGEVKIFETVDDLNKAVCNFIVDIANEAVEKRNSFVMALSGGSTPNKMYSLLAQPPYLNQMPWQSTFVFWGDERCVPLDDEQNNAHTAQTEFLSRVPIPSENIYPIPVNQSPGEAALSYEHSLQLVFGKQKPVFDLILLGLGDDGHTASLFPGTDVLHKTDRLVKEVYVPTVKMHRVTFTLPLINMATNVLFMVTGNKKAEILKHVITDNTNTYPAQMVAPASGNLNWYVDKEAGKLLI